MRILNHRIICTLFALAIAGYTATAQEDAIREYPLSFYDEFFPKNAQDLVDNTPGFELQSSQSGRGFSSVRSNILIDGVRPPPKGRTINEILNRLPTRRVQKVELIQVGGMPDLDMQGYLQVLNIVTIPKPKPAYNINLKNTQTGEGEALQTNSSTNSALMSGQANWGMHRLSGSLSISDTDQETPATFAAIDPNNPVQRLTSLNKAETNINNFGVGAWFDLGPERSLNLDASFSSSRVSGEPIGLGEEATELDQLRSLTTNDNEDYRVSSELRLPLTESVSTSLSIVSSTKNVDSRSSIISTALRRDFVDNTKTNEHAIRSSFVWKKSENTRIRLNSSLALNSLEGQVSILENGQIISVDGLENDVDEMRGSVDLGGEWKPNENLTVEGRVGVEVYEITSFDSDSGTVTRPKGRLLVAYKPANKVRLNFETERKIGQLSFGQFLASSTLDTDIVTAGAERLDPEVSWTSTATYQKRFYDRGLVEVKLRNQVTENPILIVPITDSTFVAQNSDEGVTNTISARLLTPLDQLGLSDFEIDLSGQVSDSNITDPVTLEERPRSGQTRSRWGIKLTKRRGSSSFAWSAEVSDSVRFPTYSVRSINDSQTDPTWSLSGEWTPIQDVLVKANFRSKRETISELLLFSNARASGLEPFFISTTSNESGESFSASLEWTPRAGVELEVGASSGSTSQTSRLLQAVNEAPSVPIDRSFPASPSLSVSLRIFR